MRPGIVWIGRIEPDMLPFLMLFVELWISPLRSGDLGVGSVEIGVVKGVSGDGRDAKFVVVVVWIQIVTWA